MSAEHDPETFDTGVGKLAAAIIVGVFALQIGLAGMHLYLSERYSSSPAVSTVAEPRKAAPLTGVAACASASTDISLCEVAVARVMAEGGVAGEYCPPPGDSRSVASIVRRYLVEHPDAAAAPLGAVLEAALQQAWPCRPGTAPG